MADGTFYGIGVGPGDPRWITVQAAEILSHCRQVYVPRARADGDSVALEIARRYLRADAAVHELTFPMTTDQSLLRQSWRQAAAEVRATLSGGADCCFLTLGDPLLYSTYVYLLRELRQAWPEIRAVTVPGVTAMSAAAALAGMAIGEGKQTVTILPTPDDPEQLARALDGGGTVVLMKIGRRLESVLDALESRGLLGQAVFVARAGMSGQRVETDLRQLRGAPEEAGYLSILIVQTQLHAGDAP